MARSFSTLSTGSIRSKMESIVEAPARYPDPIQECSECRPGWSKLLLERQLWLAIAITAVVTAFRFDRLPVCGEEPRRAEVIREMHYRGNYVVPTQQGQLYCTRPPLQNWAIGVVWAVWGKLDSVAIRLPSVLATIATAVVCYFYGRLFMSPLGAFCAAVCFATMGQVLQIGFMGETDPLFAFLLSSSMLLWHWGMVNNWPYLLQWVLGGILAGLAALTKGLQAPVYFAAVCTITLLLTGRWKTLFGPGPLVALAAFALVAGSWTIAYWYATDWAHTREIWVGQVERRLHSHGLLQHMLKHPFETFACMLPWSVLLLGYMHKKLRAFSPQQRQHVKFLVGGLAITYPSVWLVPEAANRYYLPMYPFAALLVGLTVERIAQVLPDASGQIAWRRFAAGMTLAVVVGAAAVLGGHVLASGELLGVPDTLKQPWWTLLGLPVFAAVIAAVLMRSYWELSGRAILAAIASVALFVGLAYKTAVLNCQLAAANDATQQVGKIRSQMSQEVRLVSLGPVFHRFRYYWGEFVPLVPLPQQASELPEDVTYFCVQGALVSSAEVCDGQKQVVAEPAPGVCVVVPKLEFRWEKLGLVYCGRNKNWDPQPVVVVGRVLRPGVASVPAQGHSNSTF